MTAPRIGSKRQPFPRRRPSIEVAPSSAKPFDLTLSVLPGWGIELKEGAEGLISWYDPPDWTLTSVTHCLARGPARVHGIDCVEVSMLEWEADDQGWRRNHMHTHFARVTEEEIQWLATMRMDKSRNILYTFLDDGFDRDGGAFPRRVPSGCGAEPQADGSLGLELSRPGRLGDSIAAGMFRVRVGQRSFTCLRVIGLDTLALGKDDLEKEAMTESFYSKAGRLVLFRRYNGRIWAVHRSSPPGKAGQTWDQRLPDNQRLIINGATFVHWYDCLTDVSLGIEAGK